MPRSVSSSHRRLLALVAPCALLFAACGDGIDEGIHPSRASETTSVVTTAPEGTDSTETDSTETDSTETDSTEGATDGSGVPSADSDATFHWKDIDDGNEQGSLEVPRDYADPSKGTFTLFMIRHLAEDPSKRIGTLLVNPGGPGSGGSDFAQYAPQIYDQALLDSFDILAWDPRGTGQTTPSVDCVTDYDPYFALDSSPDTPAEQQAIVTAAEKFGQQCVAHSDGILPYVSTENSARDMDSIRQGLDESTISYFGFSYGSELGVTWASLFPKTVRAMVVDGAADQSVGYLQQNLEQAAGFEGTFDTFLKECSANKDCAFYNKGDAEGAFDTLNEQADKDPVKSEPGRPDVTQGVLTTGVSDAMYDQSYWPQLEQALADLQDGDGAGILALYDDYYQRQPDGTYDNSLEAYFAINCLDDPGTKDADVLFDMQDEFAEAAPRLGASWILELQFCAAWPIPAAPAVAVDAEGAGPVVVVGTTGDPATPLISTQHMAAALDDGRLITVTADQHTGYGVNDCVNDAVDSYLVTTDPPDDGLICDE